MVFVSEVQPDLSLVVPVYNNATTLDKIYQNVRRVLHNESITFELLFINDAGPDNSLDILCDMVDHYPEVIVVNMQHNVGQHAAVLHGLRFAHGHCCLVMDADLQDPPEALSVLWQARSPHYQAIFAGRRGNYQSLPRMITSRFYKTLIHHLTGLPKDAGLFVLMERELVEAILRMPVRVPRISVMIGLSNFPLCSVPVKRRDREESVSAYSGWGRLRSAVRGIYCALEYRGWRPEKSYLERLEIDPVKWVKSGKAS